MEAPARVAQQTFHQPTNQPTKRLDHESVYEKRRTLPVREITMFLKI